jgi:hypothetical protein
MYGKATQLANASATKRPPDGDLGASRKTAQGASAVLKDDAKHDESSGDESVIQVGSAGSATAVDAGTFDKTAKSPVLLSGQVPIYNLKTNMAVAGAGTGGPTDEITSIFLLKDFKTPERPVVLDQHLNNSIALTKNKGTSNKIVNEDCIETRLYFKHNGKEYLLCIDFFYTNSWLLRPHYANLDLAVNGIDLKGFDREYVVLMNPSLITTGQLCWASTFQSHVQPFIAHQFFQVICSLRPRTLKTPRFSLRLARTMVLLPTRTTRSTFLGVFAS